MNKKIILITGTNSGFGWLTVHSVAALGHKVYATITTGSEMVIDGGNTAV